MCDRVVEDFIKRFKFLKVTDREMFVDIYFIINSRTKRKAMQVLSFTCSFWFITHQRSIFSQTIIYFMAPERIKKFCVNS